MKLAAATDLGGEAHQQIMVRGAHLVERAFALARLEMAQLLRRELPRQGGMLGIEFSAGVQPVLPTEILTDRRCQKVTVENPDSMDMLSELPASESILAA